ncbi:hypothetical protein O181_045605 [Austropuccinia psidii MF-1]|uniref:PIN domain-containing protein n=1 Tax=Austropuccinia psidii MF-1 TaxID=1389203 RepID=A0A9Q3DM22_9BASI|nr:hypothetical protein [Austropuccinia psidii MF-1]
MAQDNDKGSIEASTSSNKNNKSQETSSTSSDRDKLSRALGAAFLKHQVQQLEKNLDDLSFSRNNHQIRSTKPNSSKKSNHSQNNKSNSALNPPNHPRPIKIIDTSVLIHALPILKKWNRQGKFNIVIPLHAISELDFLKTSPPPIHGLVKDATCWLDQQFQNSFHSTHHSLKQFAPQRTGDEASWDELSQRFTSPPIEVASVPVLTEEGDESARQLLSTDLPRHLRSLFQCALWHQSKASTRQECHLVIFSSPSQILPHHQPKSTFNAIRSSNEPRDQEPLLNLSEWATQFSIQAQQLSLSQLAEAKQWIRAEHQRQNLPPSSPSHSPFSNSPRYQTTRNSPHKKTSNVEKQLYVW